MVWGTHRWHGRIAACIGAALAVWIAGCAPSPAPEPTRTAAPSATATPTLAAPVPIPETGVLRGSIAHWTLAPESVIATVRPQVGAAADGALALLVDAPRVAGGPATAASIPVAVVPGETYSFSAAVRVDATLPVAVPVTLSVGGTAVTMPEMDAEWQRVQASFTAGATQTSAEVVLAVTGPVRGFALDEVSVRGGTGAELVRNGSFESVAFDQTLVNDALLLPRRHAVLAVAGTWTSAEWQAKNTSGAVVGRGAVVPAGPVSTADLTDLPQGHYTVRISAGTDRTIEAPVALLERSVAVPDDRFGAHVHVDRAYYRDAASAAGSVGLGAVRTDIRWRDIEPTKGTFAYPRLYTDPIARMAARGVGVLAIAGYGNAAYDGGAPPYTKAGVAAFGRYAAAMADRLDLIGIEVWNEFNHKPFNWGPCGRTAACYAPLVRSVGEHVRPVAPDLPIVVGATANYDSAWFSSLWKLGALEYADAMSFHPYVANAKPESVASLIGDARKVSGGSAGTPLPVWITETGTSAKTGGRTRVGQASFLVRMEVSQMAAGAERVFWYDLVNDSTDPASHEGNFGLFAQKRDRVAALPPTETAFAQALLISEVGGREYTFAESAGAGVVSHVFGVGEDAVRVMWAPSGEAVAHLPLTGDAAVVPLFGSASTVTSSDGQVAIPLTSSPVFVRATAAGTAD